MMWHGITLKNVKFRIEEQSVHLLKVVDGDGGREIAALTKLSPQGRHHEFAALTAARVLLNL